MSEQTKSDTPQTDTFENELLAEYRYCEASFNGMAEHARDLERENAKLKAALAKATK